jgi:hypothetical protein
MRHRMSSDNWNELQFLSRHEFQQMAPSILQLEVTRLGKVMQKQIDNTEFHNCLVRARFSLERFIAGIRGNEDGAPDESCLEHLRTAIMSVSVQPPNLDADTARTCAYVIERLNYVYNRIGLLY